MATVMRRTARLLEDGLPTGRSVNSLDRTSQVGAESATLSAPRAPRAD